MQYTDLFRTKNKMTAYKKQDVVEEEGKKILSSALSSDFFLLTDWGTKDKYPDVDGQIRLRDGKGSYLNKYLHYQLKSVSKLTKGKYPCRKEVLDYLTGDTNVPTLLFVVEVEDKQVYWFFATKEFRSAHQADGRGKTLDLSTNLISSNDAQLQAAWGECAREDNYTQLSVSLRKIVQDFSSKVESCVGLLYVVQKISKDKLPKVLETVLSFTENETNLIMEKLLAEGIITKTDSLYLVENEQIGIESAFELLGHTTPESLADIFTDENDRKTIISRLSEIKHPQTDAYFKSILKSIEQSIKDAISNDEMYLLFEKLELFSHRYPKEALKLVKQLIDAEPIPPQIIHEFEDANLYGKDRKDLLNQAVAILKTLRYFQTGGIFDLLLGLTKNSDKSVCSSALDALKSTAEFNLQALRRIDYHAQRILIERMDKWGKTRLLEHKDVALKLLEEILEPSFEGRNWSNDTMTLQRGPLVMNDLLKKVRDGALRILKKLYSASKSIEEKKLVFHAMQNAARTPDSGGMSEELKKQIMSDIDWLIDFYIELLEAGEEKEIVKEIEEAIYWYSRWYAGENLKQLDRASSLIESDSDYSLFRTFVGYDARMARDSSWEEVRDNRNEQVEDFIQDISDTNFADWKKKILLVVKNYSSTSHGEFLYFNRFLYGLGKAKPVLAAKLIPDLETHSKDFIVHLVSGIHASVSPEIARGIMKKWVVEDKNIATCVHVLGYENEPQLIETELLPSILRKSIKARDIEALNALVRISYANFPKNSDLKKYFMAGIKELGKLKHYWWIQGIWYRGPSLLDALTATESQVLLDSLIGLENIDYHAEEILTPICAKWPEKVVEFFLKRVKKLEGRPHKIGDTFRAIPYDLHKVGDALRTHQETVLPLILSWYGHGGRKHGWRYRWEASHLIEKIFSTEFTDYFQRALIKLSKSGDKKNLSAVLSILNNYYGGEKVWGVCAEIVKKHSGTRGYQHTKVTLMQALSNMGVVSGEDGFVRAFQLKLEEAKNFNDLSNPKVKTFKMEYVSFLNDRIEFERKRADERITLRKKGIW